MNILRIAFLSLVWLLSSTLALNGQMIYKFTSTPDSAAVILNGQVVGHTPCEYKKGWKAGTQLKFEVSKPGYQSETLEISEKPRTFVTANHYDLKRVWNFTMDSASAIVGFDKVVAEFPDGKLLGSRTETDGSKTDIYWEGFARIGDESFTVKTMDLLGTVGFNTPLRQATQLFSDQKGKPKYPRFLLGVKIDDIKIDIRYDRKGAVGYNSYLTRLELMCNFQILDKTTNQVISGGKHTGIFSKHTTFQPSESFMLEAYLDALSKFLLTQQLADLANGAKGTSGPETDPNVSTKTETSIPKTKAATYDSNAEMIQTVTQSCVTIITDAGHGSGFLVAANGKILTAQHVVAGANRVEVQLASGVKFDANVLSEDETHDVALLSIPGSGYAALPIGDSKSIGPGSDVFTIGTPFEIELGQSVSKGIMSGKRKVEEIVYIQTDVSVSPGNSGGPLINSKGECVGIIQRKLVAAGVEGVGFALPIETALKELGITVEGE